VAATRNCSSPTTRNGHARRRRRDGFHTRFMNPSNTAAYPLGWPDFWATPT
jgi:hypothetical protein